MLRYLVQLRYVRSFHLVQTDAFSRGMPRFRKAFDVSDVLILLFVLSRPCLKTD